MSELIQNPTLWVALSFIGFLLIAAKFKLHTKLTSALDARAATIKQNLDDAAKIKAEAEALLAEYKQKQAAYEADAKAMLARAEADADALRKDAEVQLNEMVERRTEQAMRRIEQMEQRAVMDVRSKVIDIAMDGAKKSLASQDNAVHTADIASRVAQDLTRIAS